VLTLSALARRGCCHQKAESEWDRLAPATANLYASLPRRFCRWAVNAEYLDRDPSRLVRHQKYDHIQTQPLSSEDPFKQVLAATYDLDAHRYTGRDTPEYGRSLRGRATTFGHGRALAKTTDDDLD
jgi:hypothetical protein